MKNKTNLIAISGKAGSGKSTVGKIIQYLLCSNKENVKINDIIISNEYDWWLEEQSNFEIKQFSTKLKQIVSILTGIPIEDLEKQEVKNRVLGEEWWYYKGEVGIYPYNTTYEANKKLPLIKPTPRILLQEIGTDLFRNQLHPNVHINALFADYNAGHRDVDCSGGLERHKNCYPSWCITDLRFKNEKKAVEDRGGITIRVNRPKVCIAELSNGKKRLATPEEIEKYPEHISETELDTELFTYTINNNGSIEDLIESVKEILIKEKLI